MKRVWLIRHGHHDWIGKALVGRKSGICLSARGNEQARRIAEQLRETRFAAIYSSPQQRALETARPLAEDQRLPIQIEREIDEIDFGEWTGMSFDDLAPDSRWQKWNATRESARVPGGESMSEVQRRVTRAIERLARDEPIALVSHGDVIKAAIAAWTGVSLNDLQSIEAEPGAMMQLEIASPFSARVQVLEPGMI